ncbi:MAG: hypothetical protein QOH46_2667 [Solirubrobacteraceae bacterium]|nr:hypothetical protein [Solirubrobacteraceae bacterium]
MWRTTPLHRREVEGSADDDWAPELPAGVDAADVQGADAGVGPLFRRRYRATIREADLSPEALLARVVGDPNRAAPTEFAIFQKVAGAEGPMQVGDEYVVRMPGPWDGPVRVVDVTERSFRLVTLDGHLEAGTIEFRAAPDPQGVRFEIESWARSGDHLSNLLYHRLRMAKEIQLHMWTSFLERVAGLAGGRLTGGIDIHTSRVDGRGDGA